MKWIIFLFFTSVILIVIAGVLVPQVTLKLASHKKAATGKSTMTISSSAFLNNQTIPAKYTCDGSDVNPPLTFTDITKEAKSLVLLVDDPDAPGGTWHHYTIYNMSPATNEISENTKPSSGTEGITSFGKKGYGGPCPPTGVHNYIFTLYALDSMLDLPDNATYNELQSAMDVHVIDQAQLVGKYSRSN